MRNTGRLFSLAGIASLLLAAALSCRAAKEASALPEPAPSAPAEEARAKGEAATAILDENLDKSSGPAASRLIIRTAEIYLQVKEVEGALRDIQAKAESLGGFVVLVRTSGTGREAMADIAFRVPAEKFQQALDDCEKMALKVTSRSISGEDVTEEFVDLESQLRNLEATRARLVTFLERAVKVEEALQVNQALSEIQGQIERTQGRMKYLRQSAALSTITAHLSHEPVTPIIEKDAWRPLEVARRALRVLLRLGQLLVNLAIILTVLSPLWLGIWGFFFYLGRRRKAKKAAREAAKKEASP